MSTLDILDINGLQDLLGRSPDLPLINVLPAEYHHDEHVPGSFNVPLDGEHFVERVAEVAPDPLAPVIVYCAGQSCSEAAQAASLLQASGYQAVYQFSGGIAEWREAGLPLESG